MPDAQPVLVLHHDPSSHSGHGPPQSIPISMPLATLSVHDGGWQLPPEHTPDMQSPLLAQLLPSAHIGQYAPDDGDVPSQWLADVPQYPNGLQHCPPLHTASLAEFQPHSKLGAVATGLFGAPQSTSVSSPFCTPSLQVGDEQMFCRQTPDAQSEATAHPMPCSHGVQGPPQSVPVSAPLWMPSQQVAARHVNMVGCVAGGREQSKTRHPE